MKTVFDLNRPGSTTFAVPDPNLEEGDPIPADYLRDSLEMAELSEVEVVRHYTRLSQSNFGLDSGMYPLGSCTMKHNPKINERIAALDSLGDLHPLAASGREQGFLRMMHALAGYLAEITGMAQFSLAPAAGAHGELTSVMIMKKCFEHRGEDRRRVLIPDSAHGTNPASVAMCGFAAEQIASTPDGEVDLAALEQTVDASVAGMMLTSPNTLGVFDRNTAAIADILHRKGALFYCDGANLNALMGIARPGDMGFDLMHVNVHKTFGTPHGGGGPGAGPIGVTAELAPYLPVPVVVPREGGFALEYDRPHSIGRVHAFYGNALVLLKAYAYIRALGADGLRRATEQAVLNANYVLARLQEHYFAPLERLCLHECVLSDKNMPGGVTTNDIAKRLLDYGFHAPTIYFPLIVPGALMIEPTETENKETLDAFIDAMIAIRAEARDDPERVTSAPHTTPVGRVDAVRAARQPILCWQP